MVELRFGQKGLVAEIRANTDEIDDLIADDVIDLLEKNKVLSEYIDNKQIEEIILQQKSGSYIEVARGIAAEDGQDGTFEIYFSNDQLNAKPPRERENGSVDHHDLGYVELCHIDDLLMRLYPPTKSVSGKDVFGKTLSGRDGVPPQVFLGNNIKLSEDGLFVQAAENGYALLDHDNHLNVFTELEIKGDVDYSVGNIDFPGNVIIYGDVMNGFTIKSEKSIIVHGSVESADLIADEEVVVSGGINQKHGGIITASVIKANVLHFANVLAKEVYVTSEILYSRVNAQNILDVSEKEARVIGGEVICNGIFIVNDLGSPKEASKTFVIMKSDNSYQHKLEKLDIELEKIYNEYEKISNELKEIEDYLSQPKISPSEFHEFEKIYEDYKPKEGLYLNQIQEIESEKQSVVDTIKTIVNPELQVIGYLYSGIEFYFDTQRLSNTIVKKNTRVFEEHHVIRFLPLNLKNR